MADRYLQLHEAVRKKQPKAILEVRTWNGERAVNLLNLCPTAKYYGSDLFEDATRQTDEEEFNVKRQYFMSEQKQIPMLPAWKCAS